ncbi:MAG: TraB/GumN family protein [Candidatus Diapherotrites archaeon]|nr:TraB/GumN family protein [Candidatus Diapherotrites archaeon]
MKNSAIDIKLPGKHVRLVGTGHVFKKSVSEVKKQADDFKPDVIAVELDETRLRRVASNKKPSAKQILASKNKTAAIIYLLFFLVQERASKTMKTPAGSDMKSALRLAAELGIPCALIDRDIRTTMNRALAHLTTREKLNLLKGILAGLFGAGSEQDLEAVFELRGELMKEFRQQFPTMYRALVTERDAYMARAIRSLPHKRVLAVVGAGHIPGISRRLRKTTRQLT